MRVTEGDTGIHSETALALVDEAPSRNPNRHKETCCQREYIYIYIYVLYTV